MMQRITPALRSCATDELRTLLTSACTAALDAGALIRSLYGRPHDIRLKGRIDLVTEADVASERAVLAALNRDTPTIPVMAEEAAPKQKISSGQLWVVDPLDGTTNFAHGFPHFAVSIALLEANRPQIGVVYDPMRDELFCASRGGGTWLNGQTVTVTATRHLVEALVATGFPYEIKAALPFVMRTLSAMLAEVRDIRRAGAAALDLAYVACGRLDGFYEMNLQPWDTAAGWLLVEEAGGRISDFAGNPFSPFIPQTLASNSILHPELLRLLR
ncbi:MAG: inositol monophosphatase family protein [Desulfobulbus sp.]|jgi:myo-inositol-1(or 4)-monophosphatase